MITAEKIVYDIRRVLKELNAGDGSLPDSFFYQKVDNYAELLKKTEYIRTRKVDPSWIVNLGKVATTNANSGNDPLVTNGSVVFSYYKLPRLLSLSGNSYVRVSTGLRTGDFTKLESFDIFYRIYNADREVLEMNPVYILVDNGIYVYPNRLGVNVSLSPASPFDCIVKRPLRNPNTNAVISDGLTPRAFSIWDEYPISGDLVQQLIVEFISKEFQVSKELVQDFTQNGTKEI